MKLVPEMSMVAVALVENRLRFPALMLSSPTPNADSAPKQIAAFDQHAACLPFAGRRSGAITRSCLTADASHASFRLFRLRLRLH
jgi:hypothetical protein